ncbi:hypothetical protein [Paraburkholderia jirisanensis]
MTPAFSPGGSYTFTHGHFDAASAQASPKWNQFMVQVDYTLSRRNDVHLDVVYQHVGRTRHCRARQCVGVQSRDFVE